LDNWDLLPAGAHPGPPRAIIDQKQSGILLGQVPFFRTPSILMRASSQRLSDIRKKRSPEDCALLLVVIRLATENIKVGKDGERKLKYVIH
jgi:hypothetical protein